MKPVAVAIGLFLIAPAAQADKVADCALQGEVMTAVQQARLDRVAEADVSERILADNPEWPKGLSVALPPLVDYVYSLKMREVRNNDLGASAEMACLQNWDQIQSMKNSVTN